MDRTGSINFCGGWEGTDMTELTGYSFAALCNGAVVGKSPENLPATALVKLML
jgi:hypothetical protein